jgi:hypothetical protein
MVEAPSSFFTTEDTEEDKKFNGRDGEDTEFDGLTSVRFPFELRAGPAVISVAFPVTKP